MKYDLGSVGILGTIAIPLLSLVLSDACANEVWVILGASISAGVAWIARMKNGETDGLGRKV